MADIRVWFWLRFWFHNEFSELHVFQLPFPFSSVGFILLFNWWAEIVNWCKDFYLARWRGEIVSCICVTTWNSCFSILIRLLSNSYLVLVQHKKNKKDLYDYDCPIDNIFELNLNFNRYVSTIRSWDDLIGSLTVEQPTGYWKI